MDYSKQYIESFEYYIEKAQRLITERGEADVSSQTDPNGQQKITVAYNHTQIDYTLKKNGKVVQKDMNTDRAISNALSGSYSITPKVAYPKESTFVKVPIMHIQKTLFNDLSKKIPTLKTCSIFGGDGGDMLVSNSSIELNLSEVIVDDKNTIISVTFAYIRPKQ
jgi:hypothetical protein